MNLVVSIGRDRNQSLDFVRSMAFLLMLGLCPSFSWARNAADATGASIDKARRGESRQLIVPHVAQAPWQTFLVVDAVCATSAHVAVTLYGDGQVADEMDFDIDAGCQTMVPLSQGSCGTVWCDAEDVVFRQAFISSEGGIAEFELTDRAAQNIHFLLPNYAAETLTWSGLVVMNPTQEVADITARAFGADGISLGVTTFSLSQRSTRVAFVQDLFDSIDFSQVARVGLSASQEVTGIVISGHHNRRLLFCAATPSTANVEPSSYVVLAAADKSSAFWQVAERLAAFRGAEILPFDFDRLDEAKMSLTTMNPEYVAIVTPRENLDINSARSFFMMSTEIDADPFVDFAYGFITAVDADGAMQFVDNIIRADGDPILRKSSYLGMIGGDQSYTMDNWTSFGELPSDFAQVTVYLATQDPDVNEFIADNLRLIEGSGLTNVTGNGDPMKIWAFDPEDVWGDARYMWDFDPARVGEDPGELLDGVDAHEIAALDLYPSVVLNGACYSAAVSRVAVENDIAPTFGETNGLVRFYDLAAEQSLALAFISAGATGYLAPIGPNHGLRTDFEADQIVEYGLPLGEVMKRAYDDMVMASKGEKVVLPMSVEGEPYPDSEDEPYNYTQCNRILIGDPAFRPTDALRSPCVSTEIQSNPDGTWTLSCRVEDGYSLSLINTFYSEPSGAYLERVYAAVVLPESAGDVSQVNLRSVELNGQPVDHYPHSWLIEQYRGQRLLHVEVTGNYDELVSDGLMVIYDISCASEKSERQGGTL